MYVLQNNIDIVSGAKNLCIYNMNNNKLYSLDKYHFDCLHSILEADNNVPSDALDFFVREEIVVDQAKQVDAIELYKPTCGIEFAWIEITQNCNLMCRHCYEKSTREELLPQMSMDDFELVVNELKVNNVKRIQLVGGEPLMHPCFLDMLDIVSKDFSFVEIFTNGTLLNDEIVDHIAASGASLAFSLYSRDDCIHDYVTRTAGSHKLTSRSIEKVLSKGIQLRLASVEMINVPKYEYSDSRVLFKSDLPRLTGRADISLFDRDMLRRKVITKDTFSKPIDKKTYLKNKVTHNCFGSKVYIDSKLDVYPCVMERRSKHGNLHDTPLNNLLDLSLMRLNKDNIEGCKDCEFRYACFDCRPDSNNQSFLSKPWYCTYDPYQGEWFDVERFIDDIIYRKEVKK